MKYTEEMILHSDSGYCMPFEEPQGKDVEMSLGYGEQTDPVTGEKFFHHGIDFNVRCYMLSALASGIVFNIGASTGGTEIVAMILHKYIKVEIGRAILLSDIGTVLFAACIYGPQTGMYCVLGLIGRSTIVDTAIESLNLRKVCTVITSRPEPIRRFVTETLGRTATQQDATGVYTGEPRTMIMVALTRRQAGLLRDFLRREDPEAFLTIVNSSEIIGKGFQSV